MADPLPTAPGPRKGDLVMSCGHKDAVHAFEIDPPLDATATDGAQAKIGWLLLCAPCRRRPGSPTYKAREVHVLDEDLGRLLLLQKGGAA